MPLIRKPDAFYGVNEYATKWIVVIKRAGRNVCKSFAFSTHGGREVSLAQAQAWRDEQIRVTPQVLKRDLAERLKANNTSGIAGVSCRHWPDGRPMRWIVQTSVGGRLLTKSFGVKSHGFELARQLAVEERLRHLSLLHDSRVSRHPADRVGAEGTIPAAVLQWTPRATFTGVAGVWLAHNKRSGAPQSWTARTCIQGEFVTQSFAVATFGLEEARTLAIAERQIQLARATGRHKHIELQNPIRRKREG